MATGEPERGVEYRIQHNDGTWRWHKSAISLVRDNDRKPPYIVGIAEDITEGKLADERQARSLRRLEGVNRLQEELILPAPLEEKFKRITDTAVDLLDLDFCRIWSVLPGDLCDAGCIHATTTDEARFVPPPRQVPPPDGQFGTLHPYRRRASPRATWASTRSDALPPARKRRSSPTASPPIRACMTIEWAKRLGLVSFAGYKLHDARGNTTGVMAMFAKHPISEEDDAFLSHLAETTSKVIMDHQAEEELRQSQKLEGVGQLAGGVAHEFNNLLQVIDGYTCAGMEGLAPEDERYTDLDQVRKAAERAATLPANFSASAAAADRTEKHRRQPLGPRSGQADPPHDRRAHLPGLGPGRRRGHGLCRCRGTPTSPAESVRQCPRRDALRAGR